MTGSVRARLTISTAIVVGGFATMVAVIAPQIVRSALEDDRLDAEVKAEADALGTELLVPDTHGRIGPAELTAFFGPEIADLMNRLEPSGAVDELRALRADRTVSVAPVFGVVATVERDSRIRVDFAESTANEGADAAGSRAPVVTTSRLQRLADELDPPDPLGPLEMFADGALDLEQIVDQFAGEFDDFARQLDPAVFEQFPFFDVEGELPPGVVESLENDLLPALGEWMATQQAPAANLDDFIFGTRRIGDLDVVVSASASGIEGSVERVQQGLWAAVPLAMLLAGGMAWMLAGRALRPVRSITERTRSIRSSTLHERVPVPDAADEIADLATEVNTMLARVQREDERRRQFVADASHELRSPLAAIRALAESALGSTDETDVGDLAREVLAEAERMSTLVDDLLSLARHDEELSAPGTVIDLDDIVLDEAARTRRVPIDTSAVSAGRVRGHRDEIRRVVTHLLDNAARHAASAVRVSLRSDDGSVQLLIDDDGPGVPADQRERVFERFVRLDEARHRDDGGAGLGLAVARAVVSASGGTILVTDSDLGGAQFCVELPDAS